MTSCSLAAATILAGTQLWLPTQLRQLGLPGWKPVVGVGMMVLVFRGGLGAGLCGVALAVQGYWRRRVAVE
jgi:hypothetical protein